MKKILAYEIIKEHQLVLELIAGEITTLDYLNLKKNQILDPDYSPDFNFISDFRETNLSVDGVDLEKEIGDFYAVAKAVPGLLSPRKSAIITATPEQAVIMSIYKHWDQFPNQREVFSTLESAIDWLSINTEITACIEAKIAALVKRETVQV